MSKLLGSPVERKRDEEILVEIQKQKQFNKRKKSKQLKSAYLPASLTKSVSLKSVLSKSGSRSGRNIHIYINNATPPEEAHKPEEQLAEKNAQITRSKTMDEKVMKAAGLRKSDSSASKYRNIFEAGSRPHTTSNNTYRKDLKPPVSPLLRTSIKHLYNESMKEKRAVDAWEELLSSLRESAVDIRYRDLIQLADLKTEPTKESVDVLGYIALLLGLSPSWDVAKRLLLRELIPLQNFLREVRVTYSY
jgi:hypothetical protein